MLKMKITLKKRYISSGVELKYIFEGSFQIII